MEEIGLSVVERIVKRERGDEAARVLLPFLCMRIYERVREREIVGRERER